MIIYKHGVIVIKIKNIIYNTACYWQIMHVTGQDYIQVDSQFRLVCVLALIVCELGLGGKQIWESTLIKEWNWNLDLTCDTYFTFNLIYVQILMSIIIT